VTVYSTMVIVCTLDVRPSAVTKRLSGFTTKAALSFVAVKKAQNKHDAFLLTNRLYLGAFHITSIQ